MATLIIGAIVFAVLVFAAFSASKSPKKNCGGGCGACKKDSGDCTGA